MCSRWAKTWAASPSAIDELTARTAIPDGVTVTLRGLVQGMRQSFQSFGIGLTLSVVLLYLILVAQFRSFLDPLLILTAVPPGLTGALLILYLTGTSMNVMSLMGLMILIGMTVSDSILIVEFTRHLREEGMTVRRGGGHRGARPAAAGADDVAGHHHRPAADGPEARRGQRIVRAAGPGRAGRDERFADDDRHHGAGRLFRGLPQRRRGDAQEKCSSNVGVSPFAILTSSLWSA